MVKIPRDLRLWRQVDAEVIRAQDKDTVPLAFQTTKVAKMHTNYQSCQKNTRLFPN